MWLWETALTIFRYNVTFKMYAMIFSELLTFEKFTMTHYEDMDIEEGNKA